MALLSYTEIAFRSNLNLIHCVQSALDFVTFNPISQSIRFKFLAFN